MNLPQPFTSLISHQRKIEERGNTTRYTKPPKNIWCDFASNDYASLAHHPEVLAQAHHSLLNEGASARSSRVVCGTTNTHLRLENQLAHFVGFEDGLVLSSGYMANIAVLAALGRPKMSLVMDAHVHASIHDAAKLSAATTTFFEHNNLTDLEEKIQEQTGRAVLIVIEAIYSVLGDAAPLEDIYRLAQKYDCLLVVDESHSIGVRGQGKGLVAEHHLAGSPGVICTLSLGKALASQGGAILCSSSLRDYFVNVARTFIYDTGLSPANAGAALGALNILEKEGEGISASILDNAKEIRTQLERLSIFIPPLEGAIHSVSFPYQGQQIQEITQHLSHKGVLVGHFKPSSSPDGLSHLRFIARSNQNEDLIRRGISILGEVLQDKPMRRE